MSIPVDVIPKNVLTPHSIVENIVLVHAVHGVGTLAEKGAHARLERIVVCALDAKARRDPPFHVELQIDVGDALRLQGCARHRTRRRALAVVLAAPLSNHRLLVHEPITALDRSPHRLQRDRTEKATRRILVTIDHFTHKGRRLESGHFFFLATRFAVHIRVARSGILNNSASRRPAERAAREATRPQEATRND